MNATQQIDGDTVEVPLALLNKLVDRLDSVETKLANYEKSNEHDKATIRQRVTEAINKAEGSETDEDTDSADESGSMTPMERILRWGEDTITKHVTASDQRAKAIAEHYAQWSSKTPNGRVMKTGKIGLKRLLETATGESLAWKQVYRACEALAEFSQGAIEFTKHPRKGWMLVGDTEYITKLERSSSATEGIRPS